VRELAAVVGRGVDQLRHGLVVALELDERCRLIEGEGVVDDGRRCGAVFCDRQTGLDRRCLHARPLGDHGGRHAFERELLVCGRQLGVGDVLAVLVLHDLLHDAVDRRLVGLDDVGRDRRQSGLSCGEGAALTGAHDDVALSVAAGEDRRQDAVLLDAGHELAGEVRFGTHVRLDDDDVGVDVLDGA
jgi:hypothetical protein